ncbi:Pycsar system effector family protein [Arthrobacter sp. efr-133-TYG-118]|uniref:Pycsar system effector family protein n=1 Tax=Arthrobacter sp. efr-133-TYG-118 TaxID=3040279 RepID=UPI00254C7D23|nr:Pycsar system effector family protein [Arthrobacter sp. efr-133-TYG-118]
MEDKEAIDNAWKIHAAQVDWTGKVDAKASFAFALESAVIATTVALSADGRLFSNLTTGITPVFYWLGLLSLVAGAFFALVVVRPRLKATGLQKASSENYIYFGHAQYWESDELDAALRKGDILPVITRQIVVMADIAWQKHRWVQWSMTLGGVGGALLVACGLIQSF